MRQMGLDEQSVTLEDNEERSVLLGLELVHSQSTHEEMAVALDCYEQNGKLPEWCQDKLIGTHIGIPSRRGRTSRSVLVNPLNYSMPYKVIMVKVSDYDLWINATIPSGVRIPSPHVSKYKRVFIGDYSGKMSTNTVDVWSARGGFIDGRNTPVVLDGEATFYCDGEAWYRL